MSFKIEMKFLKINFITFIGITFLIFGCTSTSFINQQIEITGQLVDVESKKPIPNVVIYFRKPAFGFPMHSWEVFETITTDEEGRFNKIIEIDDYFEMYTGWEPLTPSIFITVNYDDFKDKKKIHLMIYNSISYGNPQNNKHEISFE